MKRFNIYNAVIFILIVFISALFTSCNKESSIGLELLPSGDLITARGSLIKDDISAYTFTENNLRTDERSHSLLGSIKDPVFGTTTVDLAAQFRLYGYPDYGKNASVDSVKLYLAYRVIYGDTLTYQKFKVYELESDLNVDASYTQDVDLKSMASTNLLGEREYRPRVRLDSATADTFYQLISIPIDNSLGEKLMAADSSQTVNNDDFLKYFKGLLIESEPVTEEGGTILSMELVPSGGFPGSFVQVYFNNDSTRSITDSTKRDTSFVVPYIISPYSARVNRIVHDYSGTPFYENLDSESVEDSLIYLQASGGLRAKITIDDLTSWADSTNTAINKAELIFQIDSSASDMERYPPPNQIYLTYIDTAGVERLPVDYSFSPDYYGGVLNTSDNTYRFNITQQLQNIIEGKIINKGFYLTTGRLTDRANRVVLKGSTSKTGINLIITYSKFNL